MSCVLAACVSPAVREQRDRAGVLFLSGEYDFFCSVTEIELVDFYRILSMVVF